MQAWLTKAGPYRIEHMPMPHPSGKVDTDYRQGVLHTIEGTLESGLNVFQEHFSPTITGGTDRNGKLRLLQHMPLGDMAAALENDPGGVETNRLATVQIEWAAHSQNTPWLPPARELDALAELLVVLKRVADIPLTRPFLDDPGPQPWATESYAHRTSGKWSHAPGWYGHMDLPENVHWDAGWLKWTVLLSLARHKDQAQRIKVAVVSEADWEFGRWYMGIGEFTRFGMRYQRRRPSDYPRTVPAGGWRAQKWYENSIMVSRRRADTIRLAALSRAARKATPALLHDAPEPT